MEFRETLLAAQRNQQQKSSENVYYKAKFDPPKKEQKQKDRLSANIQKFLAKKEEEERRLKVEAQRKKDELFAMRDPKALRKIQKTLKVIKSANKSVIADAIDREHTAVTRDGPVQPDQDDYGYESQEAAAIYQKMMEKYSKLPEEPKFPSSGSKSKKDIGGTLERVKHALQHEDDPVPHKRRRRTENDSIKQIVDKECSPPPKMEDKKKEDKPKFRKPAPPPLDFNQLLKLAEQKKSEPLEVVTKKVQSEPEPERLMTKKQKREYEEEMARRQRRQERIEGATRQDNKKGNAEDKHVDKERKPEQVGFGRIPKIGDRNGSTPKTDNSKSVKAESKTEKLVNRENTLKENEKNKLEREKEHKEKQKEKEKLEKLNAQRKQVEKDIERLNRHREMLEKTKMKLEESTKSVDKYKTKQQEVKKNIDLKSQNTYRIDKNSNNRPGVSYTKHVNGISSDKSSAKASSRDISSNNHKSVDSKPKGPPHIDKSKQNKHIDQRSTPKSKPELYKSTTSTFKKPELSKPSMSNSFDFDQHVNSLKNIHKADKNGEKRPDGSRQFPPGDVKRKAIEEKRKMLQKRRRLDSESEYDSEMDDFIDDGDEEIDYSTHIKEIFGYDKSKYNYVDDDDDPRMESSFTQQMREELHSKKIGIMEDLEDIRKEKEMKKKKKRRLDDD